MNTIRCFITGISLQFWVRRLNFGESLGPCGVMAQLLPCCVYSRLQSLLLSVSVKAPCSVELTLPRHLTLRTKGPNSVLIGEVVIRSETLMEYTSFSPFPLPLMGGLDTECSCCAWWHIPVTLVWEAGAEGQKFKARVGYLVWGWPGLKQLVC